MPRLTLLSMVILATSCGGRTLSSGETDTGAEQEANDDLPASGDSPAEDAADGLCATVCELWSQCDSLVGFDLCVDDCREGYSEAEEITCGEAYIGILDCSLSAGVCDLNDDCTVEAAGYVDCVERNF